MRASTSGGWRPDGCDATITTIAGLCGSAGAAAAGYYVGGWPGIALTAVVVLGAAALVGTVWALYATRERPGN